MTIATVILSLILALQFDSIVVHIATSCLSVAKLSVAINLQCKQIITSH